MTYRQLQQALKTYREQGHKVPSLNSKKAILLQAYNSIIEQNQDVKVYPMKKEWVNGAIQTSQNKGGYRVKGAIQLKENNSLNAPKGLIAWISYHHGTKMYSFDFNGGFWHSSKSEAYQSAYQSGELMIAA